MLFKIAVPLPVPKLFDYRVPAKLADRIKPGMRVQVPFGRGTKIGLAIRPIGHSSLSSLKEIESLLDTVPMVPPPLLQTIAWGADYYLAPLGEALKTTLPDLLWKPPRPRRRPPQPIATADDFATHPQHQLNVTQQTALQTILTEGCKASPFLLHGVTGSGKTEIYQEVAEQVLSKQGSVLILVPEISLTPQLIGRFQARFSLPIGSYHSGLTPRQRESVWEKCLDGELRLVIGTRSALFLPLQRLQCIVVDEEHDSSYKQEGRFRYHARDLAIVRGQKESCPVILGSATPSLESYHHAQSGKYCYIQLPERAGPGRLPDIHFIDLRRQTPPTYGEEPSLISDKLASELDQTLQRGEQSLLFLNRRGFHSIQLCSACGESLQCPHCSISLTLHKKTRQIVCHYCLYEQKEVTRCPSCDSEQMTWVGWGTERIEAELKERLPRARIARLDRDTTRKRGTLSEILGQMKRHEIDILIGTQILTKGHDYPAVTLVGVLLAESTLRFPDLRAAERTFQLVTQVAGRAGRGERPGQVLVQGYNPNHYSLRSALAQDYSEFAELELKFRQQLGYPPFQRLVQIVFRSPTQKEACQAAQNSLKLLNQKISPPLKILGPAPCPIEKLRGAYRWQLLLKGPSTGAQRRQLQALLDADFPNSLPSKTKVTVDVDPITML